MIYGNAFYKEAPNIRVKTKNSVHNCNADIGGGNYENLAFRCIFFVKFIYSEKATNFCEISTVDLSCVVTVKSTVEILQNFVAYSEYMNFNRCYPPLSFCGPQLYN